jgi:hypothetical protein
LPGNEDEKIVVVEFVPAHGKAEIDSATILFVG